MVGVCIFTRADPFRGRTITSPEDNEPTLESPLHAWHFKCLDGAFAKHPLWQENEKNTVRGADLVSVLDDMPPAIAVSIETCSSRSHRRRFYLPFLPSPPSTPIGIMCPALAEAASLTAPENDDTTQFVSWDSQKEDMAKKVAADFKAVSDHVG